MAIFNVKEFAAYISNNYLKETGNKISPVRLQKTLYFCFAFWGGFVRKGKIYQEESALEIDVSRFDEYLFNARFEAWVYGPVVPEIYHEHNIDRFFNPNLFNDSFLKEYIDDLLDDINEVSDFRLVDLSHQDDCWRKNFKYEDSAHSREIFKDDIINEYVKK